MRGPLPRRRFIVGLTAAGVTPMVAAACAQPERQLLDEFADTDIVLAPADQSEQPGSQISGDSEAPSTTAPLADTSDRFGEGSPMVPETDLPGLAFVATAASDSVTLATAPGSDEAVFIYSNPLPGGGPLLFLVEQFSGSDQLEVLAPGLPAGAFAWANGADVTISHHNFSLLLDLTGLRLILFERELAVFQTQIGLNTDSAPLPGGRYFTTELLTFDDPNGPLGAHAFSISGYSAELSPFSAAPGELGIHGTDQPLTVGTQTTRGSVRITNEDMATLVNDIGLPAGVPVVVV